MLILHVGQISNRNAVFLEGRFDERGGVIGRAADCTLVLPDPDKHISRIQAEIRCSNGQYSLLNRSAVNPVILNGRTLNSDEARVLVNDDEIVIAQFVLRVELTGAAHLPRDFSSDDPFGDLIPKTFVASAASPFSNAAGTGASHPRGYIPEDAFADLARFAPTPDSGRPAPLRSSTPSATSQPAASPEAALSRRPGASAKASRDAWAGAIAPDPIVPDPFAAPSRSPDLIDPLFGGDLGSDPLGLGPADKPQESVDDLFELGSANADPLGVGSPLAEPALRDAPKHRLPGSMPDQVPEIHAAVKLPRLQTPPPAAAAAGQMYRSWEAPQSPVALSARDLASMAEQAAEAHRLDFEPPPKTRTTAMLDDLNRQALSAARRSPGGADDATPIMRSGDDAEFTLLKAFLLGSGLSELPRSPGSKEPRTLDAATMQRIGELLRLLSKGTGDLLASRALTKREMRAEVTVIVAKNNNPLKFTPDASGALAHLLANRPARGFMDGPTAVRDAFEDLSAHQIGFVAGMRAAMQGLIARFDPAELEKRLKQKTVLDSMLPMNRKAKLWELFNELFGELAREAEDDFEALFGREFLRAYEAQIEQIEQIEHKDPS